MRLVDATLDDVRKIVQSELGDLRISSDIPPEKKAWLTNAAVTELLGISRSTLNRYRASGRLKYTKVGARVWYRREDVNAFLLSGVQQPDDEVVL